MEKSYEWIIDVIDSCISVSHIQTTKKIIKRFNILFFDTYLVHKLMEHLACRQTIILINKDIENELKHKHYE